MKTVGGPLWWGALGPFLNPVLPKVARSIFMEIKLLMFEPIKYFSATQRNCLRQLLHHHLVEPDKSTMIRQLPMINQTLCTIKRCVRWKILSRWEH